MYFVRYQPKVCTVSGLPSVTRTMLSVSVPVPLSDARQRSSLSLPPSLWPNCINTKSPGLRWAITASQRPCVRNVRLLRPPIARLITSILAGSNSATKGSPHPIWPAVPLRTVESPMMNKVGFPKHTAIEKNTALRITAKR